MLLTRRRLLQAGVAASGRLLLPPSRQAQAKELTGRRVIIIGAGFAGLACAYELLNAGWEVVVLESRARVGGRVRSLSDFADGVHVEAGGEFFGRNHPTALKYAAMLGLSFEEAAATDSPCPEPICLTGRMLTVAERCQVEAEAEQAYELLTDLSRPVVAERPWESPSAERLDHTSTAEWLASLKISPLAQQFVGAQFANDNGVGVAHQSLLGNLAQIKGGGLQSYWTDTEIYRCRGGNQQIATTLAERIGTDRILLNAAVATVHATGEGVEVGDALGRTHYADEVVLTAPPSTWSKIRFRPELPDQLHPQMGTAVKFLSKVCGPFWRKCGRPPSLFSDAGPGTMWLGPTADACPSGPEVLVGFVGGEHAIKWSEMAETARRGVYSAAVDCLQPGFEDALERQQFANWVRSPWTAAGYSFPAPGQIVTQGPILYEGLGRLHFAGEHACYAFVGYMEGALSSGVALARRIAGSD